MTTATSILNHNATKYEHSDRISERRRNLFPTMTNHLDDSEMDLLGQPLCSDSGSELDEDDRSVLPKNDYEILPYLSPTHTSSLIKNLSPTQTLKTPSNESSNSTKKYCELPNKKLSRKSFPDDPLASSTSLQKLDHQDLDINSSPVPEYHSTLTNSSSRVRTALFPPIETITTKSFYPKMDQTVPATTPATIKQSPNIVSKRSSTRGKRSKYSGSINHGVRHKIRKPKKRINITNKTVINRNSNKAITEYLKDLSNLNNSNSSVKLIKDVNNSIRKSEDKENNCKVDNVQSKSNSEIKTQPQTLQIFNVPSQITQSSTHNSNTVAQDCWGNFNSKKRAIDSEESDFNDTGSDQHARKFFKSTHSRGVVTLSNNVKLAVNRGGISVLDQSVSNGNEEKQIEANTKQANPQLPQNIEKIHIDITDLATYCLDDQTSPKTNLDNIISSLEDETDSSPKPTSNHKQHHSAMSIDTILSPISQMCDVTSGLALSSPKKGRNLNAVLNNMPSASTQNQQKLYPLFAQGGLQQNSVPKNVHATKLNTGNTTRSRRILNSKMDNSQMILDAGQKRFGYTLCGECNIFYHMGHPEEELMHKNIHNSVHILKFQGWRNEHVVADFHKNGRIIKVLPTDPKSWVKKCNEIMEVINRELGCPEMDFDISQSQVYLYVRSRTIIGCAVASVPPSTTSLYQKSSSTELYTPVNKARFHTIRCGITRLWVTPNNRKHGVATQLMDAVKRHFVYGTVLSNSNLAMTPLTEDGAAFAERYFKTANYLLYF